MTETLRSNAGAGPADGPPDPPAAGGARDGGRRPLLQAAVAIACALLGFLLVAQVRSTESVAERLGAEREEDLTVILSDLTSQSERLQAEITDLRLLLFEFESSAESEELVLRNLQDRLDDLRILAGIVPAENEGVVLTIDDPAGELSHELLVDVVHEMRNAGAEAVAVNNRRLVASSSFSMRNERMVLDGQPLDSPYRIAAVGPSEEMIASGLGIPGGILDKLRADSYAEVQAEVEELEQLVIPARAEPVPFVYGEPVPAGADSR